MRTDERIKNPDGRRRRRAEDNGSLIRRVRTDAGLSAADLGALLGVSGSAVCKLERRGEGVSLRTLRRAVEACGWRLVLDARRRPGGQRT